jgi:hypothetical protein
LRSAAPRGGMLIAEGRSYGLDRPRRERRIFRTPGSAAVSLLQRSCCQSTMLLASRRCAQGDRHGGPHGACEFVVSSIAPGPGARERPARAAPHRAASSAPLCRSSPPLPYLNHDCPSGISKTMARSRRRLNIPAGSKPFACRPLTCRFHTADRSKRAICRVLNRRPRACSHPYILLSRFPSG